MKVSQMVLGLHTQTIGGLKFTKGHNSIKIL